LPLNRHCDGGNFFFHGNGLVTGANACEVADLLVRAMVREGGRWVGS
jgi:hypothetical protein